MGIRAASLDLTDRALLDVPVGTGVTERTVPLDDIRVRLDSLPIVRACRHCDGWSELVVIQNDPSVQRMSVTQTRNAVLEKCMMVVGEIGQDFCGS